VVGIAEVRSALHNVAAAPGTESALRARFEDRRPSESSTTVSRWVTFERRSPMSHDLITSQGVDPQSAGTWRERTGGAAARLRFTRAFFDRGARGRGPRSRRAVVGVEAVEPRISLSGVTVRPMIEDPNIRSPKLVSRFNPQPDPPTAWSRIIAI
jgi:hypothetical protein